MENLLRVGCLDIVCCPAGHVYNSLKRATLSRGQVVGRADSLYQYDNTPLLRSARGDSYVWKVVFQGEVMSKAYTIRHVVTGLDHFLLPIIS
jgi:hypothetical protein